jgi:probable HAF family extracellular repeat protein
VLGALLWAFAPLAPSVAAAAAVDMVDTAAGPIDVVDLGTFGGATSVAVALDGDRRVYGHVAGANGEDARPVEWLGGRVWPLGPEGRVLARNVRGEVAGMTVDAAGAPRAVLWHDLTATVIHPEARFSLAVDLDQRGELLVAYTGADGTVHGALWKDGSETEVFRVPADQAAATGTPRPVAVNDDGAVAVATVDAAGLPIGSFVWRQGATATLGSLGGGGTAAMAIDEQGRVAGTSRTADGRVHAFLWREGVMTDLGTLGGAESRPTGGPAALSDQGDVIGTSETLAGETHAFLWRGGVMTDLGTLGGAYSEPAAVNALGQVAGQSTTPTGEPHPFLWTDGAMTDLGTLGGPQGHALALNDVGDVAGASQTPTGSFHATLWTRHPPG